MVRYIVRPNGVLSTPRRLLAQLRATKIRLLKPGRLFDWRYDFFLAYPGISQLNNSPCGYQELLAFYNSNKSQQRRSLLASGLPVPFTPGLSNWEQRTADDLPFVVRPFRHSQGRNYRVTSDASDYNPSLEYISQVFPKRWEYRVITSCGKPVVTMIKRVPDNLSANDPWNHANGSSFVTVFNQEGDRLRHTDIYERIRAIPSLQLAHLTGIDVLVTKDRGEDFKYAVTEVNFAPALTLPHQLTSLATAFALRS